MKQLILLLTLLFVTISNAEQLLGAGGSSTDAGGGSSPVQPPTLVPSSKTNITVISKSAEKLNARKIYPVMKLPDGTIVNDGGVLSDSITTLAIKTVAEASGELAVMAAEVMSNAIDVVRQNTNNMARNSVGIAIAFPPDEAEEGLVLHVAHETTNGEEDTFYIWSSLNLDMELRLFMKYSSYNGEVSQRLKWSPSWNTLTNVVDNRGVTWENCHIAKCLRPAWAVNKCCITEPNIALGGSSGFNFGGVTLIDGTDDLPYFTGEITNKIDRIVIRCEDGVIKDYFSY